MKKDLLTGHLLSEWATKCLRYAEYTCGEQWVDLGPVNIIIVCAEAMKQDFTASHRDRLGLPAKWFREIENWHHGVKCLLVLATFIWPGNLYIQPLEELCDIAGHRLWAAFDRKEVGCEMLVCLVFYSLVSLLWNRFSIHTSSYTPASHLSRSPRTPHSNSIFPATPLINLPLSPQRYSSPVISSVLSASWNDTWRLFPYKFQVTVGHLFATLTFIHSPTNR